MHHIFVFQKRISSRKRQKNTGKIPFVSGKLNGTKRYQKGHRNFLKLKIQKAKAPESGWLEYFFGFPWGFGPIFWNFLLWMVSGRVELLGFLG